jgi:hypothetical protein
MSLPHYRHSGRFSVPRLALVVAVCIAIAAVLAFLYAYAFAYIPIIGYVSFILAIGFGLAIGFVVALATSLGHVRSRAVTMVVAVLVTTVGYYLGWAVWLHAILARGDVDVPITQIASSPGGMWEAINAINENGVWSMHGWTPKGGVLWLFWGLELILIYAPALLIAHQSLDGSVYCESCRAWCVDRPAVDLGIADSTALVNRVEGGDLQALAELPPRGADELVWTRVQRTSCAKPACPTNTLSVSRVMLVADDEGNYKEQSELFVDRLLIGRAASDSFGS